MDTRPPNADLTPPEARRTTNEVGCGQEPTRATARPLASCRGYGRLRPSWDHAWRIFPTWEGLRRAQFCPVGGSGASQRGKIGPR